MGFWQAGGSIFYAGCVERMIKNKRILEEFNKSYIRQERRSYCQRLKLYDGLLREAKYLKKIPSKDPLEEIDSCLRVARILNSLHDNDSKINRKDSKNVR